MYCGGKTQVTNSRAQKRLNQVWRRRECLNCRAVFTTEEGIDYGASLVVRPAPHGPVTPFSRDKLFASLLKALGHRRTAVEDASALTGTVIARLLQNGTNAAVSPSEIVKTVILVLEPFDKAACVQYRAYHQG